MGVLQQGRKSGRMMAGDISSGTWQERVWRTLRLRVCLIMAIMLAITVPAGAWTVPGKSGDCTDRFNDDSSWYETQKQCQFAAQLEPIGVLVGGEKELNTGYYTDPHVYLLENAIRLFKEKGYDNWALYLSSPDRFQALADGATWADAYKGRLIAHFSVNVFWTEVYSYDYDICNYAGFDQYYNSYDTNPAGQGLDSEGLDILADSLPALIKTVGPAIVETAGAIVGVPGLGGLLVAVSIDIRPSLEGQYPSGALQSQQHYDKAIAYYFGGMDASTGKTQLYFPQRSQEYNSLFQLGWASHYIQDIGVIYHIHDIMSSFPPNPHNDFEDDAEGYGDIEDPNSTAYHVRASGWTLGTDYQNKKITELARDEANAIDNANDWAAARSDNADVRKPVVQKGVRVSEQYTAAVIAKYLNEIGIPKVKEPFQGRVEDLQDHPVPYAYVFYRRHLQCSQDPDTPIVCGMPSGAWNYVQADKNGIYKLDLKPSDTSTQDTYYVRPVMPGYRYEGYQPGSSSELLGATMDGKPLEYKPPWKSVAVTTNPYYELYLSPLEGGQPAPALSMAYLSQGMLIFQPNELTPATASALNRDMIAVTQESPVLRVHTTDAFQQKMVPLPESSYVEIELANLADLNTPRVLSSPALIRSTVLAAKDNKAAWYALHQPDMISAVPPSASALQKYQLTGQDRYIPASTVEGWGRVLSSLPKTRAKALNGSMVEVPDLSYAFGTTPAISGEFLPASGVARIPAQNAQVEVALETGPGFIGPGFSDLYPGTAKLSGQVSSATGPGQLAFDQQPNALQQPLATQPGFADATGSGGSDTRGLVFKPGGQQPAALKKSMVLTTDSEGKAALMLQTGNQAGRIRLRFRVISNPDAPAVLPEKTVELTVHPLLNVPDPVTAEPPIIQAVQPREPFLLEAIVPAGTAAGQKKPPGVCFNVSPDRSATVVSCPEKPVTLKIMDFVSSVTSALGKIPAAVWPQVTRTPVSRERRPCDDGNACTVMDRVVRGTCTGDPVICPAAGDGRAGRCDPAAGCVYGPAGESRVTLPVTLPATLLRTTVVPEEVRPVEGSPCDDGNACTTGDVFRDGACRGEPFPCNDGDDGTADSCDPRTGCVFTRLEQVPETVVTPTEQARIITPAPLTVQVTATTVPEPCPEGCSCVTRDEAVARFGRYLPCSATPCGSLESPSRTIPRYCLRPAA
jgi:hypothetical protein